MNESINTFNVQCLLVQLTCAKQKHYCASAVQRGQPAKGTAVLRALVPDSPSVPGCSGPCPKARLRAAAPAAGTLEEEEEAGPAATARVRGAPAGSRLRMESAGLVTGGLHCSCLCLPSRIAALQGAAVADYRQGDEELRSVRLFVFSGLGWAFYPLLQHGPCLVHPEIQKSSKY